VCVVSLSLSVVYGCVIEKLKKKRKTLEEKEKKKTLEERNKKRKTLEGTESVPSKVFPFFFLFLLPHLHSKLKK
jgi:heme exporter protein D